MKRLALLSPIALLALSTACTDTPTDPLVLPPDAAPGPTFAVGQVAGASYTTTNQDYDGGNQCRNGPGLVNCNLYLGKEYVWINGGPTNGQSALTDGVYFFIVGEPGGQNSHINDQSPVVNPDANLSDDYDSYLNRRFVVSGHHITAYLPDGDAGTADAHVAVTVACHGCTPGYWKNNTAAWANTGYATSHLIRSPFGQGHTFWPSYPKPTKTNPSATHGDHTLHQGLDFKGGSTLSGKGEILLRAGVAALLSASWSNGGKTFAYPLTASEVIDAVDQALASEDPNMLTETASKLDKLNNLSCPINAKGVWTNK